MNMAKRWKKKKEKRLKRLVKDSKGEKTEEKNFNPTGKQLFVLYECPNCGRNDCSAVPRKMKVNIPFFVQCGCGGWVLYVRAWFTEPYDGVDIMVGYMTGDKKILEALRHELKDATLEISPEGTMPDPHVMMQDPNFWNEFEARMKDEESKKAMYR